MIPRTGGPGHEPHRTIDFGKTKGRAKGIKGMGRLIKLVFVLVVTGFAGLTGYAYLADLTPAAQEVKQPVVLHAE